MEKISKEAIIITMKEFETIRKYKEFEKLAKEEEKEDTNNDLSIISIKIISYIIILAILIATCAITNNCYELLQEIAQTTQN